MKDLFSEDWHIAVEVKRVNGEAWIQASIDGVPAQTVDLSRALVRRVLFGLMKFAASHESTEG